MYSLFTSNPRLEVNYFLQPVCGFKLEEETPSVIGYVRDWLGQALAFCPIRDGEIRNDGFSENRFFQIPFVHPLSI